MKYLIIFLSFFVSINTYAESLKQCQDIVLIAHLDSNFRISLDSVSEEETLFNQKPMLITLGIGRKEYEFSYLKAGPVFPNRIAKEMLSKLEKIKKDDTYKQHVECAKVLITDAVKRAEQIMKRKRIRLKDIRRYALAKDSPDRKS